MKRVAALAVSILILVGCSGNGGVFSPLAPGVISQTPAPLSASATATATVTTTGPFDLSLPPTTTVPTGSFAFPAPSSGGTSSTFTIVIQPTAPTSVPAISGVTVGSVRRRVQSLTEQLKAAVIITSSAPFTFPNGPKVTVVLPQDEISPGETFELTYFDPVLQQWNLTWAGPVSADGTALPFPANGSPFSLAANVPAVFELIGTTGTATPSPSPSPTAGATATPTPAPSPSPTPTATPVPSPSPTASPSPSPSPGPVSISTSSIALVIGGSPTTQDLTVSQSGLAPTFTPTLICTVGANSAPGTVATIAPVGSATASSPGASVTFAVAVATSSPTAGSCTGSIASSAGGTAATFTVSVTQSYLTISARARR